MCGIVAEHGRSDPAALERMLERLKHRGPDDQGSVSVNGSWLGHQRLSIVDLESGKQPLVSGDGDLWLVGNGEVYNHLDVRVRLDEGHLPDVVGQRGRIAPHRRRGPKALAELNGMFAFVVAGEDGRFVAARDPVGIKPLYWAHRRRQRALCIGDARLRRRLAPVRGAVPARLLVDAAARPRALRERGARQARRSAARP